MLSRQQCPVCNSPERKALRQQTNEDTYLHLAGVSADKEIREWLCCTDCGHIYNSVELQPEELERLYERFRQAEWRQETPDQYFDRITRLPSEESENHQKVELVSRRLGSMLNREGTLLDIGCGGGVLIDTLKREFPRGWHFYGVEPTPSFASLAERRTGAQIRCEMYVSGLFDGEVFTAATCCQVLEHVPNPRMFLEQVRVDLSPSAWLYLEVPDKGDFETLDANHDRFMAQHISYFSDEVLSRLVENAGFEILHRGITRTVRQRNNLWCIAKAI